MEMSKFNYMLQNNISRNLLQKIGCPERCFLRVRVSKRRRDALVAKTMVLVPLINSIQPY